MLHGKFSFSINNLISTEGISDDYLVEPRNKFILVNFTYKNIYYIFISGYRDIHNIKN